VTGKPDPLDQLAGDFPGWRIWRGRDGVLFAWLLDSKPPLLLRAETVDELREAVGQASE
jgi:hypothetical protein